MPSEGTERKTANFKSLRLRRIAEKRCVWCGSKRLYTKYHCKRHRDRFNELLRTNPGHGINARDRKRRLAAQGLCVVCAQPAVTRQHCEPCRVRHNEHVRAWRLRNRR